ncbi:MAG: Holliday junction resolvase RuvX [Phycisphaerales bacterium]|nr:Holliday junction resolvase RuvX [Phycisphaerales bacterium]
MRYLAIDLGDKRTGLAVGDDRVRLATPLVVLQVGDRVALLKKIGEAIEEHGPGALVVGLPLNMDDSEGPMAKKARGFARELEVNFGLPVYLQDERLSSAAAEDKLRDRELTRGQKKQRRDALAAAELLMSFLQRQSKPGA